MAYESLLFMQHQSMPALHQHAIPGKATWDGNTTKMTKIECSRIKNHKTMTKSLRILAIIAAVCCYAQWIDARVYYVKTDGTGNGDSWQEAAGDLDEMMEKASSGDEIWIAKGVYKPTRLIKASKKNSRAFVLKDGVSLYGGFAGNESSIAQREKGWQAYSFTNETVLSGDDDVEDVWTRTFMNATDYLYGWEVENNMIPGTENNSNHILYSSSTLEHPTTINGITLKGGDACVWNVKAAGGAVYASGNVRIESCKVMENSAYFTAESAAPHTLGGAVYWTAQMAQQSPTACLRATIRTQATAPALAGLFTPKARTLSAAHSKSAWHWTTVALSTTTATSTTARHTDASL